MLCRKIAKNLFPYYHQRLGISHFTVKDTLNSKPVGTKILVQGWVQAVRKHKNLYFVDLVDRTCFKSLQVVIENKSKEFPMYGSSIKVEGLLIKSSHKGQEVELTAEDWSTLGSCSPDYPFEYRKKYSSEYIRLFPHLRPRTRKISSILRIRNNASFAVHQFFQNEEFCFIHTPIITQNDCEGAGEVFSVQLKQKLLHEHELASRMEKSPDESSDSESESEKITEQENASLISSKIDHKEFFGAPTFLTVSGQLHLEAMACALARVYNFGPVFRAEKSRSRQHVSEFQMIEAEIAFIDSVEELIKLVEKCVKYIAKSIFDSCCTELQFLSENGNQQDYLEKLITESFTIMSYNDAINILDANKKELEVPIKWGGDLATDHKNFLVKHCNNMPVFVIMFPSSLKPFYMKNDVEKKEAYCFDLFAPFGGEICGGSLRENNEEVLKTHSACKNLSFSWYMDLRKYGAVPHGGFGIGFDRLLQSLLGIPNIRDIVPFPRRKYDCKC